MTLLCFLRFTYEDIFARAKFVLLFFSFGVYPFFVFLFNLPTYVLKMVLLNP